MTRCLFCIVAAKPTKATDAAAATLALATTQGTQALVDGLCMPHRLLYEKALKA